MLPKINVTIREQNARIYPENQFIMRFDGCSKSNPGIAGAGAVIYHDMEELWADSFFVGENSTNNHAEYAGLILGLEKAKDMNIKKLHVEGDSLLVINQMKGIYKCNSPNLIDLYERAKTLETHFNIITFNHILRNKNKRADQLSNLALEPYFEKS